MKAYTFTPTAVFKNEQIAPLEEIQYNGALSAGELNSLNAIKLLSKAFNVQLFFSMNGYNNFMERKVMVSPHELVPIINSIMDSAPGKYVYSGDNVLSLMEFLPIKEHASPFLIHDGLIDFHVEGRTNAGEQLSRIETIKYKGDLSEETNNSLEVLLTVSKAFYVEIVISLVEYRTLVETLSLGKLKELIPQIVCLRPGKYEFEHNSFIHLEKYKPEEDGVRVPLECIKKDNTWLYQLSLMSFTRCTILQYLHFSSFKKIIPAEVILFASVKTFKSVFSKPINLVQLSAVCNLTPGKYELMEDCTFYPL